MKRTIATAFIALATLGTAAGAMTAPSAAQLSDIRHYAPQADLSALSTQEVSVLLSIVHGGDSESEKRQLVQAILR